MQPDDADPVGDLPAEPIDDPEIPLEVRQELQSLTMRVHWLELELDLCGKGAHGAVGRWLATLPPEESERWRTTEPVLLRKMGWYLEEYPVLLFEAEAHWMMERIRKEDWSDWGPTVDEAIILFLGTERLKRELTEEQLVPLREFYFEDGYFD